MKRLLIYLIIVTILISSGCKPKMTIEKYLIEYDETMYYLEKFVSDSLYLTNHDFFNNDYYFNFSSGPYKQSLEQLINTLDNVMYNLNEIGFKINDDKIQQYQSKIEYALKDIRSKINNYTYLDAVNTYKINRTTLYKETYLLMVDISESLIDLKTYMNKLDDYVDEYRDYNNSEIDLHELKELKTTNRLRILFTYLYTSAHMASYDDYTGLHTNPKIPAYISLKDGMFKVYELAFEILKPTKEFANNYFEFKDTLQGLENKTLDEESLKDIDENILKYAMLLDEHIKSINQYYNIRNQFEDDFYTSGEFTNYQKYTESIWHGIKKIDYYDFDNTSEEYDFMLLREYYIGVKSVTFDDKYFNLMFSPEEVNEIDSTQE